jgi:hypothetical protein
MPAMTALMVTVQSTGVPLITPVTAEMIAPKQAKIPNTVVLVDAPMLSPFEYIFDTLPYGS